ncbi:unnamed protein product [Parascedosporium putredinis]|uniref:Uncharacterized protein n=1 Tax=Parascedosporium putredinis TaxID=1442378 RepID=A0A9P1M6G2_9PEZI|nr:unnamed protein product [Parascedosporium putredinis]CAI7988383.1 unnamed protein product [Parascedosporium putredinis]
MADPKIDIQNLLQTGSFPTGRTRTSERGDIDQHPVILENEDYQYAHNPEQRFVLVTDPTAPAANEPVVNDRKNTEPVEQRFVLVSIPKIRSRKALNRRRIPTAAGVDRPRGILSRRKDGPRAVAAASKLSPSSSSKDAKPSAANRRKSPHDLPRLDTEGADGRESRRRPRHMRSRSSTSAYDDYRSYEPQSPTHGGRPAQDDFLSPEVIKHGPRNREQVYHPSGSRPQPAKQKERFTEERPDGPSFNRGPRSISPGPKRSRPGSELPSKHTSRRSSRGSPPRPETLRGALARRPESPTASRDTPAPI